MLAAWEALVVRHTALASLTLKQPQMCEAGQGLLLRLSAPACCMPCTTAYLRQLGAESPLHCHLRQPALLASTQSAHPSLCCHLSQPAVAGYGGGAAGPAQGAYGAYGASPYGGAPFQQGYGQPQAAAQVHTPGCALTKLAAAPNQLCSAQKRGSMQLCVPPFACMPRCARCQRPHSLLAHQLLAARRLQGQPLLRLSLSM